ncbi:MAG: hypothetical protein U0840_20380 [Gemmataceae bacterium]
MSLLPQGQQLSRVLPDLDEMLEDPQAYLNEAPLAFGPRRMYGLAWMFGVPGAGLLALCAYQGKPDGERIAMGVGLLVGSALWFGWSILLRGHEMVLHADGVEFTHFDTSVWVPWGLFHVEGRPFVPESDSPQAGLTLPIDPKMVPYVRMRRHGMDVAFGRNVDAPQFHFSGRDEIILPARYEISALDIGELLLVLGHRLGSEPPRDPPPHDAEMLEPAAVATTDPSGWITLPLTRLRMPTCCARCGGPRDHTLKLQISAPGDWALAVLPGGPRGIEMLVPVCEVCKDVIESRQRRGGFLGMALGAVIGTAVGVTLAVLLGEARDASLWVGTAFGLVVGTMLGTALGLSWSRRLPVRVKNYSPSRGIVSVRFENPEIAAGVVENLRQRDRVDETP